MERRLDERAGTRLPDYFLELLETGVDDFVVSDVFHREVIVVFHCAPGAVAGLQ